MKKLTVLAALILFLVGCGKSVSVAVAPAPAPEPAATPAAVEDTASEEPQP